MAQTPKRPAITGKTADEGEEPIEVLTPEEQEEEDTEAVIAAEFGQGDSNVIWAVKVWRAAAKGEPEPYLFTCSPNELPIIDRLRDQYGTGTYRVRVFKNNRVYRYFTVVVEAVKQQVLPPQATTNETLATTITQAMERQSAMIERLMAPRHQQVAAVADPMAMITTILGVISQVKGLFAPAPSSNPDNAIELIMKGAELAQNFSGGGKSETGFMDLLRELIKSPMVEKMLESATMPAMPVTALPPGGIGVGIGEQPPPPIQPVQPAPQPVQPQPEGQSETVQQHAATPDPQAVALVHNIKYLAMKAAKNADVELYADWVIDNVPQEILMQIIAQPNAVDMLANLAPEAAPYKTWFAALLQSVNQVLTDGSDDAQDTGHVQPGAPTSTVVNP